MEKIKLEVLGLSYSQTQAGAYALILSIENDNQRIPIIIGGFEAQSIAIQLENLTPPRPLTHDLFLDFAGNFDISLTEILIYKLEEGIFYSKLYFRKNNEIKVIEARTSDAVALALRFGAPIYTTYDIIEKAGIVLNFSEEDDGSSLNKSNSEGKKETSDFTDFTTDELHALMNEFINNEEYEKASLVRDELIRREEL